MVPSLHGAYLRISLFLCSPLFLSSLLPVQLELPGRQKLSTIDIGCRRYSSDAGRQLHDHV
jgi:hypothetical protein